MENTASCHNLVTVQLTWGQVNHHYDILTA